MTEHQTPWATASSQFPVGMEIPHDDPDAVADICFVHGLTGDRRCAWTAHQQSETWLNTLLPSPLDKVRILSFGHGPFDWCCQDPRPFRRHALDAIEYVALKGNHEDIVKIGSPEDYCFEPIVDRLNKWKDPPVLLKNAMKITLRKRTTSFQTGRRTKYAQNNYLRRHRHRDCTTRQPVPQPSVGPRWDYEIFEPSESASPPASFFILRPCYVLCFLMFLIIGGSASLGIYYSVRYDKMGDGFTAAGWIVAIGALILAGPLARHYPHCSCWGTDKQYSFELGRIETLPAS